MFHSRRGLGTPATRASIIEELIAAGYVERKKKQLVSTDFGRRFVNSLPDRVKSAELTAHWERMLSGIENGEEKPDVLLGEIEENLRETVNYEKNKDDRQPVSRQTKAIGKCPRCGSPVVESPKTFHCTKNKDECGFYIYKDSKLIGRSYTAAEISELLNTGKVTLKNCTSSKGRKYSAVFSMEDSDKYVSLKLLEFVNDRKKK